MASHLFQTGCHSIKEKEFYTTSINIMKIIISSPDNSFQLAKANFSNCHLYNNQKLFALYYQPYLD